MIEATIKHCSLNPSPLRADAATIEEPHQFVFDLRGIRDPNLKGSEARFPAVFVSCEGIQGLALPE